MKWIKIGLLLSVLWSFSLHSFQYTLSICAIFQNEAPYLKEWIDYHKGHGVEHFWLYNNNSTDDFRDRLAPYIKDGLVELIEWPSTQEENDWKNFSFTIQTGAYNDGLKRSKGVSKWLALIDTDEFIVIVNRQPINQFLERYYPHVSGLCVAWQCYGTSHIQKFPEGKMLENLTMKMRWNHDWNKNSKSIVQPLHVAHCPNPHFCVYLPRYWAIDANYNRCDVCVSQVLIDKIRLNHYWARDESFLHDVKMARYLKWGMDVQGILNHAERMNEEFDPILSK